MSRGPAHTYLGMMSCWEMIHRSQYQVDSELYEEGWTTSTWTVATQDKFNNPRALGRVRFVSTLPTSSSLQDPRLLFLLGQGQRPVADKMTSTVAIGRAFELHALKFLNYHLHMCVRQVGGSGDEGIDLRGFWYVPAGAIRSAPVSHPSKYGGARTFRRKWGSLKYELESAQTVPGWGKGGDDQYGRDGWSEAINNSVQDEQDEGMRRIRVLAQCKAESKPLSSRPIREMEGVLAHFHGE